MPSGIYKRKPTQGFQKGVKSPKSDEWRRKNSLSHKGIPLSEAHKQALRVPRKGAGIYIRTPEMKTGKFIRTEEQIKKMSEVMIRYIKEKGHSGLFQKGRKPSREELEKLSKIRKGEKHSEEWKKQMSDRLKEKLRVEGFINSPQARRKISISKTGAGNPMWEGGKSFEPYSMDWTKSLKISIRERDHYTCQLCGEKQCDRAFAVHHIDYNKLNCNPANLITLCLRCHIKTNTNRDYWQRYFENDYQQKLASS